jgi:hypothetical protein
MGHVFHIAYFQLMDRDKDKYNSSTHFLLVFNTSRSFERFMDSIGILVSNNASGKNNCQQGPRG